MIKLFFTHLVSRIEFGLTLSSSNYFLESNKTQLMWAVRTRARYASQI